MENITKKVEGFYQGEINDYMLYKRLAEREKDEGLKNRLHEISEVEKTHAKFWRQFLENRETKPKDRINSFKINLALLLQKLISPSIIVSLLEAGETKAVKEYYAFLNTADLTKEGRRVLKSIIFEEIEHESIFKKESGKLGANNVRDFILGMNDGIVEILGTVAGLSAVYAHNPFIVGISGLIVGIAGALSMGIGAFISVRSQRQIVQSKNERNRILFFVAPEKAKEDLANNLKSANLPESITDEIMEKIDLNSVDLGNLLINNIEENELSSGFFTAIAYLLGVLFPVAPFFAAESSFSALPFSVLFAALALSTVGIAIAVVSGISVKKKIVEMVGSSFFAALFSFGFGNLMQALFHIH